MNEKKQACVDSVTKAIRTHHAAITPYINRIGLPRSMRTVDIAKHIVNAMEQNMNLATLPQAIRSEAIIAYAKAYTDRVIEARRRNDIYTPAPAPANALYELQFGVTYFVAVKTDKHKNWTLAGDAELDNDQLSLLDKYIRMVMDQLNLLTVQDSEVDTLGQTFTRQLNQQLEDVFGIKGMFGAGKTTQQNIMGPDDVTFKTKSESVENGQLIDVIYQMRVRTDWRSVGWDDTEAYYEVIDNQDVIQNMANVLKDIFENKSFTEGMAMSLTKALGSEYRRRVSGGGAIPGITAITLRPGEVHDVIPLDVKGTALASMHRLSR